jgi:hypothetical protein
MEISLCKYEVLNTKRASVECSVLAYVSIIYILSEAHLDLIPRSYLDLRSEIMAPEWYKELRFILFVMIFYLSPSYLATRKYIVIYLKLLTSCIS